MNINELAKSSEIIKNSTNPNIYEDEKNILKKEEVENIFDIEDDSSMNKNKINQNNNFNKDISNQLNFLGYSTLAFYSMNHEGCLIDENGPKKLIDVWGMKIKNMFYDFKMENIIMIVI